MIPGGPERGEVLVRRLHYFPSRQFQGLELYTKRFLPQLAGSLEWTKNVPSIHIEIERPCWSSRHVQRRFMLRPVNYSQWLCNDEMGRDVIVIVVLLEIFIAFSPLTHERVFKNRN